MVDPLAHAGFSGKIRPHKLDDAGQLLQFGAQLPSQPFPYYADSMMEMAFVQPVLRPSASHSSVSLRSMESSDSGQDAVSTASKTSLSMGHSEREPVGPQTSLPFLHQTMAMAGGSEGGGERFNTLPTRGKQTSSSRSDVHSMEGPRSKKSAIPQDCAAMVVWLERYEDHAAFPLEALTSVLHGAGYPSSGGGGGGGGGGSGGSRATQQRRMLPCIFIHRLPSGLYQVTTTAPRSARYPPTLPQGTLVIWYRSKFNTLFPS